jgi:hypothetical protein
MKNIIILMGVMLAGYSCAHAYDDLLSFTGPDMERKNFVIFDTGLVYQNAGERFDADGNKHALRNNTSGLRIPLLLKWGVTDAVETFALLPVVLRNGNGGIEYGGGDLWLGAKYAVLPAGLLTLRGAVNLATGSDRKGTGDPGGTGLDAGIFGKKWVKADKLLSFAQAGVRWTGEDSDTKLQPGFGVYFSGELGYKATPGMWIHGGLELIRYGDNTLNGATVSNSRVQNLDFILGMERRIREHSGIDISLIYTPVGANSLSNIGLRIGCGHWGF